jgi:hypothetical protein
MSKFAIDLPFPPHLSNERDLVQIKREGSAENLIFILTGDRHVIESLQEYWFSTNGFFAANEAYLVTGLNASHAVGETEGESASSTIKISFSKGSTSKPSPMPTSRGQLPRPDDAVLSRGQSPRPDDAVLSRGQSPRPDDTVNSGIRK